MLSNLLIYPFRIKSVVIFRRWVQSNMMQCSAVFSQMRAYRKVPNDDEASQHPVPPLSRYSRRLLVSGIARSGHHKSIRAASRSCFEVVLWYTWLHRMQHRKATWYDMTRCIKVNRVARCHRERCYRPFKMKSIRHNGWELKSLAHILTKQRLSLNNLMCKDYVQ